MSSTACHTCKVKCILSIFVLLNSLLAAQSFEGYLSGINKDLPVWIDLDIPRDSGAVLGTYFYKKVGGEIVLTGRTDGKNMVLEERDKKGETTGIFALKSVEGGLMGTWSKPGGMDTLRVELHKANPAFKKTARIPRADALIVMDGASESTLADEIAFYTQGLADSENSRVQWDVLFARHNLLSICLIWENAGYTALYGARYHTFDLSIGKEINLWDHLTPELRGQLTVKVQQVVSRMRTMHPDLGWLEGLQNYNVDREDVGRKKKTVDELFTVVELPEKSVLYFCKDSLCLFIEDYFGQNYSAGNRAVTFNVDVGIPLGDLKRFVVGGSVLDRFYYTDN